MLLGWTHTCASQRQALRPDSCERPAGPPTCRSRGAAPPPPNCRSPHSRNPCSSSVCVFLGGNIAYGALRSASWEPRYALGPGAGSPHPTDVNQYNIRRAVITSTRGVCVPQSSCVAVEARLNLADRARCRGAPQGQGQALQNNSFLSSGSKALLKDSGSCRNEGLMRSAPPPSPGPGLRVAAPYTCEHHSGAILHRIIQKDEDMPGLTGAVEGVSPATP